MGYAIDEGMKKFLCGLLTFLSPLASADSLFTSPTHVVIQFDEPVVSLSTVEADVAAAIANESGGADGGDTRPDDARPNNARASELFTLTGDDAHRPVASWEDQDRLCLTFVPGTSCSTVFRLTFKPGSGTYLSGRPLPKESFTFSCPPDRLEAQEVSGLEGGGWLVWTQGRLTRESLRFSAESSPRYAFRRVLGTTNQGELQLGEETVPGVGTVARLRHGLPREILERMARTGQTDWASLTPDSPLPGVVLVQPEKLLDSSTDWALTVVGDEADAFLPVEVAAPAPELETAVNVQASQEKTGTDVARLQMVIRFRAPIPDEQLPQMFQDMDISLIPTTPDGKKAADAPIPTCLSEDGKSRSARVGDELFTFTLLPPEKTHDAPPFALQAFLPDGGEEGKQSVTYHPQGESMEMKLAIEAPLPALAHVVLKKGIRSTRGLASSRDHLHAISLHPAEPLVQPWSSGWEEKAGMIGITRLPLHGNHHLRLSVANISSITAQATRLSPLDGVRLLAAESADEKGSLPGLLQRLRKAEYRRACLQQRQKLGLLTPDEKKLLPVEDETVRSLREDVLRRHQQRQTCLKQAETFSPLSLTVAPEGEQNFFHTADIRLSLDELTGGNTRPGFYLIRARMQPLPSVVKAWQSVGLDASRAVLEEEWLVQVSDLQALREDGTFLITRLSDGSPVQEGELRQVRYDEAKGLLLRDAQPVKDGLARSPSGTLEPGDILLLRSGEDSLLLPGRRSFRRPPETRRLLLQTDRLLYRPGETVHLCGILRRQGEEGCQLPTEHRVTWWVEQPDGERLLTRTASLSEAGVFDASFALPEGEEDIVGPYTIHVEGCRESAFISCQIFRRNAFEGHMKVEIDPVAPRHFRIHVQTKDYNQAPLSDGKLQLNITSSVPVAAEGTPLPPAAKESAGKKEPFTLRQERRLDTQGQATLTCTLASLPASAPLLFLNVEGSIANEREEYLSLAPFDQRLFSADFLPVWHGHRLALQDVRTSKPLTRDQNIHLRLLRRENQPHPLPNGFTLWKEETLCLWEGNVTIPANSTDGVAIPWGDELLAERAGEVELRGTDAEGHQLVRRTHLMPRPGRESARRRISSRPLPTEARLEGAELLLPVNFSAEGTAHLLLTSPQGIRHLSLPVRAGKQELRLPLTDHEWNSLSATALLVLPDDEGLFTRWEGFTGSCKRPRPENNLHVEIDPFPAPLRPGSPVQLTGRVAMGQDRPAQAEVTLWAVDAGMDALAPHPLLPLATYFHEGRIIPFRPLLTLCPGGVSPSAPRLFPRLLPGVWKGERLGADQLWKPILWWTEEADGGTAGVTFGGGHFGMRRASASRAVPCAVSMQKAESAVSNDTADGALPADVPNGQALNEQMLNGQVPGGADATRWRRHFTPTPLWKSSLPTDEQGRFRADFTLPDTLTTYRLLALAVGKDGDSFGQTEEKLTVSQPLMLTPGLPLFMSTGDTLLLPLTVTNLADKPGTWHVRMDGEEQAQDITLDAGATGTLFFTCRAGDETERRLRWQATGENEGDAVEGSFPVRFPAPLLRETHRRALVATNGEADDAPVLDVLSLLSPELAESPRLQTELHLSASPLLHLSGCVDTVLSAPYGCTEQIASALLPWMLHKRLAPLSPRLRDTRAEEAEKIVTDGIARLFRHQQADGGWGYWRSEHRSSPWVSAHVGLVLTLAQEMGYPLPEKKMQRLRNYLAAQERAELSPFTRYAIGRTCRLPELVNIVFADATRKPDPGQTGRQTENRRPGWWNTRASQVNLAFLAALRQGGEKTSPEAHHAALLEWMRSRGHDHRHHISTWQDSQTLLTLAEYFLCTPERPEKAEVRLSNGDTLTLDEKITRLTLPTGSKKDAPCTLTPLKGTTYMSLLARAKPLKTDYAGITEKGLQITRLYEKKGKDGQWHEARDFRVGDVVRVTLTCAKAAPELEYFVLEDTLPACMEAINPDIPSQAAGADGDGTFDHREYLADRVRGFCTRWCGRNLLTLRYHARVKRAGTCTAPPAQAQLLYEPQTCGLSPSAVIISR